MRAAFCTSDDRATVPKHRSPAAETGKGGADTAPLIAREDLVARLDHATTRKVTVIAAPAGSGKTSLLRVWSGRRDKAHRLAFVSVIRREDPRSFRLALLSAIRQAAGKG